MVIELTDRRQFLSGLLATGLTPQITWADAGSPKFLSAAAELDGSYVLCGLSETLEIIFQLPLPARGHAAAAHPSRPEAVAFARRPGTFAIVIDCISGVLKATLSAPDGRHFYGHGCFSRDGRILFTTENDFEVGQGKIGVWDVTAGYVRIDEFSSGGIGPHDIKRLPDSDTLVIANGGIDTHPDSGRTKLNLTTMASNLSYIVDARVVEKMELAPIHQQNSIRHLATAPDGTVAFGMQWQGDKEPIALIGTHKRGGEVKLANHSTRQMQGYIGSIAFSRDGTSIAATSPRGAIVQQIATERLEIIQSYDVLDASGISKSTDGFLVTSGTGILSSLNSQGLGDRKSMQLKWDNHLVRVT